MADQNIKVALRSKSFQLVTNCQKVPCHKPSLFNFQSQTLRAFSSCLYFLESGLALICCPLLSHFRPCYVFCDNNWVFWISVLNFSGYQDFFFSGSLNLTMMMKSDENVKFSIRKLSGEVSGRRLSRRLSATYQLESYCSKNRKSFSLIPWRVAKLNTFDGIDKIISSHIYMFFSLTQSMLYVAVAVQIILHFYCFLSFSRFIIMRSLILYFHI